MEAYGDEYEPPPPRLKGQKISTQPTTSHSFSQTMDSLLENLFQQAADTLSSSSSSTTRTQKRTKTPTIRTKVLQNFEPVLAASSLESTSSQPASSSSTTKATTKSTSPLTERQPLTTSTVFPFDLDLTQPTDELITATSTLPTTQTDSQVFVTKPGLISPEELQKALVFEQAGQPKILIVDRRTKSKSKPDTGGNSFPTVKW